jgi:hypothetical protein
MTAILSLARRYGISPAGRTLIDLVRAIQRHEGNFECFGTARDYCDQNRCLFRPLCLALSARTRSIQARPVPGFYSTTHLSRGLRGR